MFIKALFTEDKVIKVSIKDKQNVTYIHYSVFSRKESLKCSPVIECITLNDTSHINNSLFGIQLWSPRAKHFLKSFMLLQNMVGGKSLRISRGKSRQEPGGRN